MRSTKPNIAAIRQKQLDQEAKLRQQREDLRASFRRKLENKSRAEQLARSKARRERRERDKSRVRNADRLQENERQSRELALGIIEAQASMEHHPISVWTPIGGRSPPGSPRARRSFKAGRSSSLPMSRPLSPDRVQTLSRSKQVVNAPLTLKDGARYDAQFKRDAELDASFRRAMRNSRELDQISSYTSAIASTRKLPRPPSSTVPHASKSWEKAFLCSGGAAGSSAEGDGYESPITPVRTASASSTRRRPALYADAAAAISLHSAGGAPSA